LIYLRQRGRRIARRLRRRAARDGIAEVVPVPMTIAGIRRTFIWIQVGLEALTWRASAIHKGTAAVRALLEITSATLLYIVFLSTWIVLRQPESLGNPILLLKTVLTHPAFVALVLVAWTRLRIARMRLEEVE
jgi:hypothetical protein